MPTYVYILAGLLVMVTTALLGFWLLRRSTRQPYSVEKRAVAIQDSWRDLRARAGAGEVGLTAVAELFEGLDDDALAAIEADLIKTEAEKFLNEFPLTEIRKEIMSSVDRRLLHQEMLNMSVEVRDQLRAQSDEIPQDDETTRRYLHANELRMQALRCYAGQRFGDQVENDWFSVYEQAARYRQRNIHKLLEASTSGNPFVVDESRQQAIQVVDHNLRQKLLAVPPGTVFDELEKASD